MDNIPLGAQIKTSLNGKTRFDFVYNSGFVFADDGPSFISWMSKTVFF